MAFDPPLPFMQLLHFVLWIRQNDDTDWGQISSESVIFQCRFLLLMCRTVLFCCLSCTFLLVFLSESRKRRWNWEIYRDNTFVLLYKWRIQVWTWIDLTVVFISQARACACIVRRSSFLALVRLVLVMTVSKLCESFGKIWIRRIVKTKTYHHTTSHNSLRSPGEWHGYELVSLRHLWTNCW